MAEIVEFGEYSAFITKNSIRFQHKKRLVSEDSIPTEVSVFLRHKLNMPKKPSEPKEIPVQRFPRPSEEELARMREESLIVKPELQGVNTTVTEEDIVAPLTQEDFENEYNPDEYEDKPDAGPSEDSFTEVASGEQVTDPSFLESVSIHTASIQDIAEALYNRFGLYTVYLSNLPQIDDINPLTGETFTKYHLGIAYQAAIKANASGVLNRNPEENRKAINEGRYASEHMEESLQQPAYTVGEARRQNNFDYRTSVRGTHTVATTEIVHEVGEDGIVRAVQREIKSDNNESLNGVKSHYDATEDEPIAEPPIFGTKPIIRPNW